MLTIREAQQETGLSYITFQRSISDGTIRHIKQGNKYLVYEEDLHLLPKPRNTGTPPHVQAKTERSLQEPPFHSELTGEQAVAMKKWETIQMMVHLASQPVA